MMYKYLCILNYTNGSINIILVSDINPNMDRNFDYDGYVQEWADGAETNWIICDDLIFNNL